MTQNYVSIDALLFDRAGFMDFVRIAQEGKLLDAQLKIVMDEMLATGKSSTDIVREK